LAERIEDSCWTSGADTGRGKALQPLLSFKEYLEIRKWKVVEEVSSNDDDYSQTTSDEGDERDWETTEDESDQDEDDWADENWKQ